MGEGDGGFVSGGVCTGGGEFVRREVVATVGMGQHVVVLAGTIIKLN